MGKALAKKEVEQNRQPKPARERKRAQALSNHCYLALESEISCKGRCLDLEKERDQVKNQLLLQEKENELSLTC